MRDYCKNQLNQWYSCKDAIEDLNLAIQKANSQRNTEPARHGRGWAIPRKW